MRLLHKLFLIIFSVLILISCEDRENEADIKIPKNIKSKINLDFSVQLGDPYPIALDLNEDNIVDYSLFLELTANSSGDHLYAGINPIGAHQIISSPEDDDQFLNMGFVQGFGNNRKIHSQTDTGFEWTGNFSTLVIRHKSNNQADWHEGNWKNNQLNYAPIRLFINNAYLYGWIGIRFDIETERLYVSSFAYNQNLNQEILAGER
ncbi:MAG: hypothetical protein O9340_12820 [Cyclobacteriaceae bacterium]|jgi:hypothetical protein|nr:hypothetical protein [Cyclobacteriaceae bacterium]